MSNEPDTESKLSGLSAEQRLALSERRYLLLAENARDVVWSMTPAGEITYISSAIEKLSGMTPEEAMTKSLDQTFTPPSRALVIDFYERLRLAVASGESLPTYHGDLEYYREDGTTFWTEVFACALTDDQGQLVEVLGLTHDTHERKQYEDGLKDAAAITKRADNAKSEFLAHISDEIRTPLSTLLSWLHLASEQTKDQDQSELIDKAQHAGQLLLGIINDLLDLSRLEKNTLTLDQKPFSLQAVLTQVEDLMRPLCERQSTVYESALTNNIPVDLIGDPTRLAQALLNLTSNAVKFTAHGEVSVWVEAIEQNDSSLWLRFNVRDTGLVIAPNRHTHLFNNPFQIPDSPSTQISGTGLGLSITKRLAKLMHGTVGFNAELDQGSTFWFTAQVDIQVPEPVRAVKPLEVDFFNGKRILVVEDYESLRQAMCRTLKGMGFEVDSAANGLLALEKLNQKPFDLVLMDLYMPVMGGQACAKQIRQTPKLANIPIIGMTATGFAEDRNE
jgi:PAS domain S-box-containing protein